MTYVFPFDHPHEGNLEQIKEVVGGKGANLAVMTRELELPVPPGFTISTDACRAYLRTGWPEGLDEEIRAHLGRVEAAVGRRFGDPEDPLLVSVRSGAPVSMPGMMDTILNLGLNEGTARGLAEGTGDAAFVAGCRSRLLSMYRDIVGVPEVPADPWEQLRDAIEAVFRSWNSPRARSYREREGIPEDLGTAVNVQTMVFGNLGDDSGTGVLFTRNPATGEAKMYGDVMFNAQGEDVVAGTHKTEDISVLDERMPEVAAELWGHAVALEKRFADMCDIEFTIERQRLWMLQVRVGKRSPQAALRIAVEMADDPDFPLTRAEAVERVAGYLAEPPMTAASLAGDEPPLTGGLPASPGLASGEVALTPERAAERAEAGRSVILVRRETSPDDVHGMARSAGILTSTGGLASHAAVVARGWGIPAVVGAEAVRIAGGTVTIGERAFAEGDSLTIDGSTGDVYAGAVVGEAVVVPEAATLLEWARELGIGVERREEAIMAEEAAGDGDAGLDGDSVVSILLIKGFVTPEALAPILGASESAVAEVLDRMAADGLVELFGSMFKLSDDGRAMGMAMLAADRESWGTEAAEAALDGFLPLDVRMKEIVTAWQMREVDGQPVMNDHSDQEYDEAVLADFGQLANDADVWLRPLVGGLPRLERYRVRLERAAARVAAGEHANIASPRLDSYHNVWFELHEDLILLAGRTREDEVAAGRA